MLAVVPGANPRWGRRWSTRCPDGWLGGPVPSPGRGVPRSRWWADGQGMGGPALGQGPRARGGRRREYSDLSLTECALWATAFGRQVGARAGILTRLALPSLLDQALPSRPGPLSVPAPCAQPLTLLPASLCSASCLLRYLFSPCPSPLPPARPPRFQPGRDELMPGRPPQLSTARSRLPALVAGPRGRGWASEQTRARVDHGPPSPTSPPAIPGSLEQVRGRGLLSPARG